MIRYWNSVETRGEYLEGDVTDMRPIVAAQTQQLVIDKACFDGLTNDAAERMLIEVSSLLLNLIFHFALDLPCFGHGRNLCLHFIEPKNVDARSAKNQCSKPVATRKAS